MNNIKIKSTTVVGGSSLLEKYAICLFVRLFMAILAAGLDYAFGHSSHTPLIVAVSVSLFYADTRKARVEMTLSLTQEGLAVALATRNTLLAERAQRVEAEARTTVRDKPAVLS